MIKKVKKVKISIPKEKKDIALFDLQKASLVMLPLYEDHSELDLTFEEEIVTRCDIAIKKMSAYIKQNRRFFKNNAIEYHEFASGDAKRIFILNEVESLFDKHNFLISENKEEENLIRDVIAYKDLAYTTKELSETLFTTFYFGYIPENKWEVFKNYSHKNEVPYVQYLEDEVGHHILAFIDNDLVDEEYNNLFRFGFEKKEMPVLEETIASYIRKKEEIIQINNLEISQIEETLASSSDQEYQLKILSDQMLSQIVRKRVIYTEKKDFIFLNGCISAEKEKELEEIIKSISMDATVEFDEPTEFDNVPTLLENKKIVQPFEPIMNTYSVPNYTEIDPAPVMAFWYWIIFGLMMGDIGYGLMMLIIFGLFTKYKKPQGEFGSLIKVFFYSGTTSIFAGIIYGSFFGANFDLLKLIGNLFNQNWTSVLLNPVKDPIKMLIFSIGLGILHLSTGLVMKIRLSMKRRDYSEGLSKGVSWLFILIGLSLFSIHFGLGLTIKILKTISLTFIFSGIALMLIFGGAKNKGIFGKIFGGFGGIFKATSYLSDILSYSRILALALTSSIIGSTMNLLASLIQGNIIGMLLSPIVYIVGHVFTFAMGMLSAYVHGGRLEYLEFFSKFFEGGGYLFKPFKFNTKYIYEIKH